MVRYGKRKTIAAVSGHQDCSTCHPVEDRKASKKRARRLAKVEIGEAQHG